MMTTLESNTKYHPDSPSTYEGMRVGLLKGNMRSVEFIKFAEENNFHYTPVYYDSVPKEEDGLRSGEVDAIVIAGMGGHLMISIIEKNIGKFKDLDRFVLQPQSDAEAVRRFLIAEGFCIVDEDMVFEDGKYYPMMRAVRGEASLELAEYRYGPILVREMSPVFVNYLENEKHKLENVLEKLHDSQNSDRVQEVKAELALIDEVRNGKYAG
jgi:tRNA (adenine22-N1)-methyltransferase